VTDPTSALAGALRAPPTIPVSFVIWANGTVRRITDPPVFTTPEQMCSAVEEALRVG